MDEALVPDMARDPVGGCRQCVVLATKVMVVVAIVTKIVSVADVLVGII